MHKRVTLLCYVVCLCLLLSVQFGTAQKVHRSFKNGISKPYTQATHPFGVLFYTVPHNFRARAEQVSSLNFQLSSGNIWGQPVTTFVPTLGIDRSQLTNLEFYSRGSQFNQDISPSESYTIAYDGVIKDFRITSTLPLSNKNDITITARSFLLTKGTFPFTTITGDRFIEFFHETIAGGDDPFGRELLGVDRAQIAYTDRNGNSLSIADGEFVFSGIETAFYHYPELLSKHHIYINLGAHLGTNLSQYNSSMDVGFSIAGLKEFQSSGSIQALFGLGLNVLRKGIISFQPNQADLGTSNFIGSFEGHFEVYKQTNNNGYHSIGLNYRIQTPYNHKKEEAYYVPTSQERIKRWHDASRQLYKYQSYWSLIYSFTKKTVFSVYLQQDMLVNNAPDLQTGIRLKIPLAF
ncbi:hypothetical protein [Flagellimonas sp. 2504JD4-2]